jgi:hypothetical protein
VKAPLLYRIRSDLQITKKNLRKGVNLYPSKGPTDLPSSGLNYTLPPVTYPPPPSSFRIGFQIPRLQKTNCHGSGKGRQKRLCQERRVELGSFCVRKGGWSCEACVSGNEGGAVKLVCQERRVEL